MHSAGQNKKKIIFFVRHLDLKYKIENLNFNVFITLIK